MYASSEEIQSAQKDILEAFDTFESQVNVLKQTINGTNIEGSVKQPLIQKLDEKETKFASVRAEIDNAQQYMGQQNTNLGNTIADINSTIS